eukprot:g1653.t1
MLPPVHAMLGRSTDQLNATTRSTTPNSSSRIHESGKLISELTKTTKILRPDLVVEFGRPLVTEHHNRALSLLGEETYYNNVEEICKAALLEADLELAKICRQYLARKFLSSSRVKLLDGLLHEYASDNASAAAIYDQLLKENPTNSHAMKRAIVNRKSAALAGSPLNRRSGNDSGKKQAAITGKAAMSALSMSIEETNAYLSMFDSDEAAWLHMADLQCKAGKYAGAAFAMEQLILLNPVEATYHVRYASLSYTLASSSIRDKNLLMNYLLNARRHYAEALGLQRETHTSQQMRLRALFGLLRTCYTIATDSRVDFALIGEPGTSSSKKLLAGEEKRLNKALYDMASKEISRKYASEATNDKVMSPVIEQILKSQAYGLQKKSKQDSKR